MINNMDSDLKALFDEIQVSEENSNKLYEAGINSLIDLATSDPNDVADVVNDDNIVKCVKTLNDDVANIVDAKDVLLAARSSLGLRRQQVSSDASPTENGASQPRGTATHNGFRQTYRRDGDNIFVPDSGFKMNTSVVHHHGNRVNINIVNSTLENVNLCLTGDHQILNFTTDKQKEKFRERQKRIRKGIYTLNGKRISSGQMQLCDGTRFIDSVQTQGLNLKDLRDVPTDDYYPVNTKPRALLLNNTEFENKQLNRPEAISDTDDKLPTLLKQQGFYVEVGNNKKGDEMMQIIKEFKRTSKDASMILLFIGTHGGRLNGIDCFVGTDGKRHSFDEVLDLFKESAFGEFKGKPKIFLNQFCRRDEQSPDTIKGKEDRKMHDLKDTLVVYSTMPGCLSYRATEDGTWFVSALVKVFKANAGRRDDFLSLITKVNNEVTMKLGEEVSGGNRREVIQMCDPQPRLTKKIYFINVEKEG